MRILIINGPNLNLLGQREPDIYGDVTLAKIEQDSITLLQASNIACDFYQSNAEHEIVNKVQASLNDKVDFIIINPAAFTHTSVAIRDALAAVAIPFIEVHLSNPHTREPFRKTSYFSDLALGVIAGFADKSYTMACQAAVDYLHNKINNN